MLFKSARGPELELEWHDALRHTVQVYEGPLAQAPTAKRAMLAWALAAAAAVHVLPPEFQRALLDS